MITLKTKRGIDLFEECGGKEKFSPLWKAMIEGNEEMIKLLIEDPDADPDEKCRVKNFKYRDHTFLQYVASSDDEATLKMLKVAEILMKHGANVDTKSEYRTPFEIALEHGNVRFVELSLKNGARLPERPEEQAYLLQSVVWKHKLNRKRMTLMLLENGLDTSYVNDGGENLLHVFTRHCVGKHDDDAVDIAKILLKQPSNRITVDGADNYNCSPLHYSIDHENLPLVKFFLKNGANVDKIKQNMLEEFPLYIAAYVGNVDIINLLFSYGASVTAQNSYGNTALYPACLGFKKNVIRVLLQKGVDVSVANKNGETAFSIFHHFGDRTDGCANLMIREFSKLSYDNISIAKIDMELIQARPRDRKYFEECVAEVHRMASTVFYAPFTYYSVIKMSKKNVKKLALLTKNEEFLVQFRASLSSFPYFQEDLRIILKEAVEVKYKLEAVESRLKYVYNDFVPYTVIRKLTDNLTLDDLPLN